MHGLTPEEIDEIAEKAAAKAVDQVFDRIYRDIGKGIVRKIAWVIGIGAFVLMLWLARHDYLE